MLIAMLLAGVAPEECAADATKWRPVLEADATSVRPGERVRLSWHKQDDRWGEYLPAVCLTDWEVSDSAVTLSTDKRTIVVAADAKPGAAVTISARFGDRVASVMIDVIAADAPVLWGKWHEVARQGCPGTRLAELVFGRDGHYTFTFPELMVETMVSGSGDYRWDPATGALTLDARAVLAVRDGDTLTVRDLPEDMTRSYPTATPESCEVSFRRTAEPG